MLCRVNFVHPGRFFCDITADRQLGQVHWPHTGISRFHLIRKILLDHPGNRPVSQAALPIIATPQAAQVLIL
ncbi:MAG: hypothetical protein CMI03_16215 [Oceanospirillaceae bacterium]|nr:hypothetical protein [Oceanospirillaceae bacterium]MBS54285.1 hypothetical protein [Oceanospirillaceae bacterium]